jgi:sec-independent protein translocase protein TatA
MPSVGPFELIIVLVVVLLLFGSTRLPKLAKSLGEASKEFKKGINDDDAPVPAASAVPAPADEKVTMTRAELDALLAEREAQARKNAPPSV